MSNIRAVYRPVVVGSAMSGIATAVAGMCMLIYGTISLEETPSIFAWAIGISSSISAIMFLYSAGRSLALDLTENEVWYLMLTTLHMALCGLGVGLSAVTLYALWLPGVSMGTLVLPGLFSAGLLLLVNVAGKDLSVLRQRL